MRNLVNGSLYSIRLYTVVHESSNGDDVGIYLTDTKNDFLKLNRGVTDKQAYLTAMLSQASLVNWPSRIFLSADPRRAAEKYGARAYRNLFIEAGCVFQNLHLVACQSGLSSRVVTGLDDKLVERLLGLPEHEMLLGAIVLG